MISRYLELKRIKKQWSAVNNCGLDLFALNTAHRTAPCIQFVMLSVPYLSIKLSTQSATPIHDPYGLYVRPFQHPEGLDVG